MLRSHHSCNIDSVQDRKVTPGSPIPFILGPLQKLPYMERAFYDIPYHMQHATYLFIDSRSGSVASCPITTPFHRQSCLSPYRARSSQVPRKCDTPSQHQHSITLTQTRSLELYFIHVLCRIHACVAHNIPYPYRS